MIVLYLVIVIVTTIFIASNEQIYTIERFDSEGNRAPMHDTLGRRQTPFGDVIQTFIIGLGIIGIIAFYANADDPHETKKKV